MKKLFLTDHAQDAIEERKLELVWLEKTVRQPDWTVADPRRPGVERRFRVIPEFDDRVMRVACLETESRIRILTAFFDRNARKPR